ncbi:MAG: hypothetical protein M1820_001065 [Bogoriella megaspora]|nr:MAG: hypothetical protein M1820_001065 [Bogoriella megaspora]
MEVELVNILFGVQSASDSTRRSAEQQLVELRTQQPDALALGLASFASQNDGPVEVRQAALLSLKTTILALWSPRLEEFKGPTLHDETKSKIRQTLFQLATDGQAERKVESAAAYVLSKIASSDYPQDYPELLPQLLQLIPSGSDAQLHGSLKVLGDLVEECFSEEQFLSVAGDLVKVLYSVASNEARKPVLRALAISVFKSCVDSLEMLMEEHKAAVKNFADETLNSSWIPFFINVLKSILPPLPSQEQEDSHDEQAEAYRGAVALKLQVMKALMCIRSVFSSTLLPHSLALFSATWSELSVLQPSYHELYNHNERQGRLEDADGLPYTLDFLVLEDLDFLQACLRAAPVKEELQQQIRSHRSSDGNPGPDWMPEILGLAFSYAHITAEEEGLWDVDVNIFLSEETSVTANYTPRTACGDLVMKLGEWLPKLTLSGLLSYTRRLYSTSESWKAKEAALYILNQLLADIQDAAGDIKPEIANGFLDFIRHAIQQPDNFLRARGHLAAGSLTRAAGETLHQVAASFMEMSLQAISGDGSEVVKVSCIRTLQHYLQSLPPNITLPMQATIINTISNYLQTQDLSDLAESEDVLITVVETMRDAILLDTRICLDGAALNLLFTIAGQGATNFQVTTLAIETFEDISSKITELGNDAYARLCGIVLPSLTAAFDMGSLTQENALTNFAAELLSKLAEHGLEPLPPDFVRTVMPKLNRLLLNSTDEDLLRSATSAVKFILVHDHQQMFGWHDESGKGGLEVVLFIIDRLLSTSVDDSAAAEVGGLAAELVEKAGSERLGPYLMQLLRGVAVRLASAEQAQFIQSLILVFARLSLISARDVVDFLAQVEVGGESGLQVVMSKWLENSIMFAGYDEIRQNVIALSKLYNLDDPRLSQVMVKGDLIIPQSNRIKTRSQSRNEPDQFTAVPASLKIVKVLVEELLSASGANRAIDSATLKLAEEGSDDDGWEDESNTLDLASSTAKIGDDLNAGALFGNPLNADPALMAYANDETPARQRDDETQAYLIHFFQGIAEKPGFGEVFSALTPQEQEKLHTMG